MDRICAALDPAWIKLRHAPTPAGRLPQKRLARAPDRAAHQCPWSSRKMRLTGTGRKKVLRPQHVVCNRALMASCIKVRSCVKIEASPPPEPLTCRHVHRRKRDVAAGAACPAVKWWRHSGHLVPRQRRSAVPAKGQHRARWCCPWGQCSGCRRRSPPGARGSACLRGGATRSCPVPRRRHTHRRSRTLDAPSVRGLRAGGGVDRHGGRTRPSSTPTA